MSQKASFIIFPILAGFIFSLSSPAAAAVSEKNSSRESAARFAAVGIPFIENRGQIKDDRVRFFAKMLGGTLFVTRDGELVYGLLKTDGKGSPAGAARTHGSESGLTSVRLTERIAGQKKVFVHGEEKNNVSVSFFRGSDQAAWQSNLPTYGMVSLGEVSRGIEVKLKAHGANVEKLFFVKPGAHPEAIRVAIDGAQNLEVNASGGLDVKTSGGTVAFTKPVAWQEVDGIRVERQVRYVVAKNKSSQAKAYGFHIKAYDKTKPLCIDPLLVSTFLGGTGADVVTCMTKDGQGNIYVAGTTHSSDFSVTAGSYDTSRNDTVMTDVFVAKLNPGLTQLIAATYLGGASVDEAYGVALDRSGNVYVAGDTTSSNFPTTSDAYKPASQGLRDVFVAKLNSGFTQLLHSTYIGGAGYDALFALCLDKSGNVYVAGQTGSSNFPFTVNAYDTALGGVYDAFIAKLNSDLTSLSAATYLGGSQEDLAYTMAVDSANIYVGGETKSTDFPVSPQAYQRAHGGGMWDGFVAKLNKDLTLLSASTYLGGSANDLIYALCFDPRGALYVGGETASANFPATAGTYDTTHNGLYDAFIIKLNTSFSGLAASTLLGGSGYDAVYAIALDVSENVVVAGDTTSNNFPTTADAFSGSYQGGFDAFVVRCRSDLTNLIYATLVSNTNGSNGNQHAFAALTDTTGGVYMAGNTNSDIAGIGSSTLGSWDAFIIQLDAATIPINFIDNGDGTVTDKRTGLMWQQATAPSTCTWEQALANCESLELGGHTDWRLPTAKELASIVDTSLYEPSINPTYFPSTMRYLYWSSTTYAYDSDYAWCVSFSLGDVGNYRNKTGIGYVRAVRSGQSGALDNLTLWPVPDTGQTQSYTDTFGEDHDYIINQPTYTKLAAGCTPLQDNATSWAMVRDKVTGLIWEEKHNMNNSTHYADPNDADNSYTWYDSNPATEDYINGLNTANYGGCFDWRMPTVEELQSIVDYGRGDLSINTLYFPNTKVGFYWSSATAADDMGLAWGVDFGNGVVSPGYYKSNYYYVRAVRTGPCGAFGDLVIAKSGIGAGTVISADGKIYCGSDCTEVYRSGTEVKLRATAASGSIFVGWSGGGCSGPGDCIMTMNTNQTVTANFNLSSATTTTPATSTIPATTTTTTSAEATTTTTVSPSQCPAQKVLGADNPKLEDLRNFRDSKLAQSAVGRRIISIYYNNAVSVNAALCRSPALKATARWVLETIAPMLGKKEKYSN